MPPGKRCIDRRRVAVIEIEVRCVAPRVTETFERRGWRCIANRGHDDAIRGNANRSAEIPRCAADNLAPAILRVVLAGEAGVLREVAICVQVIKLHETHPRIYHVVLPQATVGVKCECRSKVGCHALLDSLGIIIMGLPGLARKKAIVVQQA
jgi:hypothetical protein